MFTALLLGIIVLVAGTAAATLFTPDRAIAGDEPVSDEVCERLVRDADILAVRSAFDAMLLRKGLLTGDQLELIRHGTRSRAVVTGMRTTGASREDYWEVELDVMVRKPGGGQLPAHETADSGVGAAEGLPRKRHRHVLPIGRRVCGGRLRAAQLRPQRAPSTANVASAAQ